MIQKKIKRGLLPWLFSFMGILAGITIFTTAMAAPQVKQAGEGSGMEILEGDKSWSELGQLSIFSGNLVNGEKVIAPGSEGSYRFTLKNYEDYTIDYTFHMSETNDAQIPLEIRLREGDRYLIGDEKNWIAAAGAFEYVNQLSSHEQLNMILEWRWLYETDSTQNTKDTALGIRAIKEPLNYKLNFEIRAEQNGDIKKGPDPGTSGKENAVKTSDGHYEKSLLWFILSGVVIISFIFKSARSRRKAS